ncbi:MAG: helix-turn-helix domain-containing protein [Rhizobiaceae bacterium]
MRKSAYTIDETSHELCVGRSKIYLLIAAGELKARKLGKRTIILTDDLQSYLNSLPEVT